MDVKSPNIVYPYTSRVPFKIREKKSRIGRARRRRRRRRYMAPSAPIFISNHQCRAIAPPGYHEAVVVVSEALF
jgi:hypothetical protein